MDSLLKHSSGVMTGCQGKLTGPSGVLTITSAPLALPRMMLHCGLCRVPRTCTLLLLDGLITPKSKSATRRVPWRLREGRLPRYPHTPALLIHLQQTRIPLQNSVPCFLICDLLDSSPSPCRVAIIHPHDK